MRRIKRLFRKPKLYAWQPTGHGPFSFFVMAKSEDEAKASVDAYIEKMQKSGFDGYDRFTEYDYRGWDTDSYTLHVLDIGEVIDNCND